MMEMSWTHSSRALALGVLFAVVLATVGVAGAVSFTADDPEAAEVGDTVEFEVEIEDPFDGMASEWTVQADSELEGASWTLVSENVAGDEVERSNDGTLDISSDDGVDTVSITVQGTVPDLNNFDYEDIESEHYLVLEVSEAGGSTLESWSAHRYTEDSQIARQAIDDASEAAEDADSDSARDRVGTATSLYNSADFSAAIEEAERAEDDAEGEAQTQQLLIVGGAAVVVLAVLGGGYYLYSQRKQNTNKLQ